MVSGPSGVGKSTALAQLGKQEHVEVVVSYTTRPRRHGEVDKVDYSFVTEEEFGEMITGDRLLEWVQYDGHFYGTPKHSVAEIVERGEVAVLEIERRGAMAVRSSFPQAVLVLLKAPFPEELERRLRSRGASGEFLNRRLALAEQDTPIMDEVYDVVVTSTRPGETVEELNRIIQSRYLPRPAKGMERRPQI